MTGEQLHDFITHIERLEWEEIVRALAMAKATSQTVSLRQVKR